MTNPVLLHEAEKILQKHDPAQFESTIDAFPECIEYMKHVEDEEAWKAGYPSLESFYQAHEAKHPYIRVYGKYSRNIETVEPLERTDIGLPPIEKLKRLHEESEGDGT